MPKLQKIVSLATAGKDIEDLLTKEWLLTNNRGSYASSTVIGCNTRRYHGLLIGSLNPPANRIMALANCLEMVIIDGKVFNLSTFDFHDKFAPDGFGFIKKFRRDIGAHFDYQLDTIELTKSVYLLRDTDAVALVYDFTTVNKPIEFVVRPFVGLRDFHTLQKSYATLCSTQTENGVLVHHDTPGSCRLLLTCPSMDFEKDKQWWFNFAYLADKERGQDFTEDLWTPGFFKCRIEGATKLILMGNFCGSSGNGSQWPKSNLDIDEIRQDLTRHQNSLIKSAKAKDAKFSKLCLAADQFISKRQTEQNHRTTILAGFPWFADWGRDSFISLPGLLLSTGRFDEAKSVLSTFAGAAEDGLIPNRFDDRSNTAYFNSIDSSLWFINAAFQYLNATDDIETFEHQLLPTIHWIIDSYYNGTKFDVHADSDELITAGNGETQLTWMDARYEGVPLTPRHGKAVEINALWYNGLCCLAQFYADRNVKNMRHYKSLANRVKASFRAVFWNEDTGYLNDCVFPDGSVDTTLRPNQIFAISLPFSPLTPKQQKSVLNVVQEKLLTPFGLRTLNPEDSRYKPHYSGPLQQRDEAYHQGTVWPYLIGPFVQSYLKVNDPKGINPKVKTRAAQFLDPLIKHLTEDGCLGQVCEIFDADAPHNSRGCIAQAWSIAELIRAYQLISN